MSSLSGEAAEQIVRIGLAGTEMAIKLTGTGAKHLAVLLYSILSEQKKTAGKTRIVNMLRTGKELKIFTIKEEDLPAFTKEAKRYGILYCALRGKNPKADSTVEIMVKEEDAPRINRIVDKLKLAAVDVGKAVADVKRSREAAPENPTQAKTGRSPRSGNTSKTKGTSGKGSSEPSRKSVRKEIDEIRKRAYRAAQRDQSRNRASMKDRDRDRARDPDTDAAARRRNPNQKKGGRDESR